MRAILHAKERLNIKSLSHIYKEAHALSHAVSRLKADSTVNAALDSKVSREKNWARKQSIAVYSETQLNVASQEVSNTEHNRVQKIKNKIKSNISDEFHQSWINQIRDLTVQGRFLELLKIEKNHVTWRSLIYNLPRGVLQFAINAAIDTLATNANLKRWGKRSNAKCNLCGQRETLHHVLNNCNTMLERYGWRHDSILAAIYEDLKQITPFEIHVDLQHHTEGISTIPLDICVTKLRPDMVFVNRDSKEIVLFELSVPFETNIQSTHGRKVER